MSTLLTALQKFAYDMDKKGRYTEADKIDEMIKSLCERTGLDVDAIVSIADDLDGLGLHDEAGQIDEMIKVANCPQCGNNEFKSWHTVCDDCGYPYVKEQREPLAKHSPNVPPEICPNCGAKMPFESEICGKCYHDINPDAAKLIRDDDDGDMDSPFDFVDPDPRTPEEKERENNDWEIERDKIERLDYENIRNEQQKADWLSGKIPIPSKGEATMFDKLMKLANELDRLGRVEEANEIDEILKSIAADEIDPDEAPVDLTAEEDLPPEPAVPEQESDEVLKMREEYNRLMEENKSLKLKKLREKSTGGIKISPKGAVSVYGLGRFPITLYSSQWQKLLEMKEKILSFIEENKALMKVKE